MAIHPTNDNIYIGAASGIFVSSDGGTTFQRITKPSEALNPAGSSSNLNSRPDGGSRGLGLSPDGKYMYATYQTQGGGSYGNKRWAVFMAKLSDTGIEGDWIKIMDELPANAEWYDPKVDPRSTAKEHKVAVGTVWNNNNNRIGLWEATVNFDDAGDLSNYQWDMILNLPKDGRCFDFEPSWENRDLIVRSVDYTPTTWSKHQVVAMGGMNLFISDVDVPEFPCTSWKEIYGEVIYHHDDLAMSHERGFSSTYCYDVDAYKSYMIQGCADHGIMQSLDHGYSWTAHRGPNGITNAMSVLTVPTTPALVLIDARKGYGIPSHSAGGLYAKEINLDNIGWPGNWKLIGGGVPNQVQTTNGLPSRNYRAMTYDPSLVKRVYVTMRGKNYGGQNIEGGIYVADDIVAVFNGTANWRKISLSSMGYKDFRDIWVDPNNNKYVYVRSDGSNAHLYRGERQSDGSYTWTNMESNVSGATDLYAWDFNGQTYLVAAGNINNKKGVYLNTNPQSDDWNATSSWEFTGLDVAKTLEIRPQDWWENQNITLRGLAAFGNHIVISSEVSTHKKGNGTYLGEIQEDGSVAWSDWTRAPGNNRDIENPMSLQAKVKIENDRPYYYVALAGTGPWRRQMDVEEVVTCDFSVDEQSLSFTEVGGEDQLTISSVDAWDVESLSDWITVEKVDQVLNITVKENTSGQHRSAEIVLKGCKDIVVDIQQKGAVVEEETPEEPGEEEGENEEEENEEEETPDETESPTSIGGQHQTLTVYPNPFTSEIKIKGCGQIRVYIYNLYGQVVHQEDYSEGNSIDLSHLSKGQYVLKVVDEYLKIVR
ncbi:T9SS type A sorting domain-containing protein [Flammeovirga yaeyamensis]|uniref:T9SS type A sorting domain-containing protein n=1 Tax=Flammeovirga yaeyamensis TaxID=367791 RepID=A0AAX1NCB6_9BACT|nr:T9SS type A sorting domain-containing protein [Flammeovirga yaeyamensis]MBB3697217.1 hypothetical protein [Flammeovirga yaeyamensis]NMF33878.1 T9SS type A sorting domain-containing protein [Flammeovirga yaeyamensis]QWG04862.1 T9SS type A sorting domain-containing protein [Flammeovirga yaeyamensis]